MKHIYKMKHIRDIKYLYYMMYKENSAWRDIYINHIIPKIGLENESSHFYFNDRLRKWEPKIIKYQYCMNHPRLKAQFECLKCGKYAFLCFICITDKSNIHHKHPKKALFLDDDDDDHSKNILYNNSEIVYCINHYNIRATS